MSIMRRTEDGELIKQINGEFDLPGSKSLTNRVLLLAALSEGTTVVDKLLTVLIFAT